MNVNIGIPESGRIDTQLLDATADQAQCSLGRFLHYIADMARQEECALAWVTGCFDMQHFSSRGSVGKPRHHTRSAGFEPGFANITRRTQDRTYHLRGDGDTLESPAGHFC